ncbi:MAG: folate-binding protein YgfZ [Devosia sp.]|nr:folate-binding protein YgfZ [Devosia sp.]
MTTALRDDRAVFRFSGPDAHKLLNDVVTGPIPKTEGPAAWWALLTPQGKVLAEGLAGWFEEALWLDVHRSVADDFFKRMRTYRLRAQVVIEDLSATHRVGFTQDTEPGGVTHTDRHGAVDLGWRTIAPVEETAGWLADGTIYARERIAAGIPQLGADFPPGEVFAHDMGLDLLDGIDFDKGCYVGQEVVSRMKHRGTARRRPVLVTGVVAPSSSPVLAGGREAGTLGAVVDGGAVAILRLDRVTDPAAVTVAGQPVTVSLPLWATYHFGESGPDA